MIEFINIPTDSSFFETVLDGELVRIDLYYSKSVDRYLMDVENKRLKRKVNGIVVNVGIDLLSSSGRIGLQALVLISMPQPRLEATLENFESNLRLAYMDLETYDRFVLGEGSSREQWMEQTPNAF